LTKMNTMLTSGRLSGNERLRHLKRRTAKLLGLSVTQLVSPQVGAHPMTCWKTQDSRFFPGLFDTLKMSPVCSEESPSYCKFAPQGHVNLSVTNPGKRLYLA
jgi:hypothetical protein